MAIVNDWDPYRFAIEYSLFLQRTSSSCDKLIECRLLFGRDLNVDCISRSNAILQIADSCFATFLGRQANIGYFWYRLDGIRNLHHLYVASELQHNPIGIGNHCLFPWREHSRFKYRTLTHWYLRLQVSILKIYNRLVN